MNETVKSDLVDLHIIKLTMPDYTLPLDQLPDPLPIEPLKKPFDVTITPPGSKSITCRAYVLAALAQGESKIIRPLRADDTDKLLDALCTLGAEARWAPGGDDVYIKGVGGRFPRGGHVNLGDGGTPTRFMIACACLAAEPVIVDGSARMRERPIAEGVDLLRQLGATIEYIEEEGRLPVRVVPSETFKGGELTVGRTASSQFISAVMLIAPWLETGLRIRFIDEVVSESYVRITADLLGEWGAQINRPNSDLAKSGIQIQFAPLSAFTYYTEVDASSAAFWFEAAVCNDSKMEVRGIAPDTKQPDLNMLDALEDLGMIVMGDESGTCVEGTGGWRADDRDRDTFDFRLMPDASLAFAVCAAVQSYRITLTGLRTLRVKETDRIAALANELRNVGCEVETTEDSITITPIKLAKNPPAEPGATGNEIVIETYNDHRMAMAFAVLGLVRPGISIRNPACVRKSYPNFWRDFAKLYQ